VPVECDPTTNDCSDADTCNSEDGFCQPNNKPCSAVTDSLLCPIDTNLDKGTCVGGNLDEEACLVGFAGNATCENNICSGGDRAGRVCGGESDCVSCVEGGGTCDQSSQFNLAFTPDVQEGGRVFKHNASNPGQTFFNVNYDVSSLPADGDGNVLLELEIPYPFITVGGSPIHVYDAADVGPNDTTGEESCELDGISFLPPEEAVRSYNTELTLDDWINGVTDAARGIDCDQIKNNQQQDGLSGLNESGSCTVEVRIPKAEILSGLAYVNIHLDYGLKGKTTDANPVDELADRYLPGAIDPTFGGHHALNANLLGQCQGGTAGTCSFVSGIPADMTANECVASGGTCVLSEELAIENCKRYVFAHYDVDGQLSKDFVESGNQFKKISGAFGNVWKSDSGFNPVAGTTVKLLDSSGSVVESSLTDKDGFYTLIHPHKGKAASYTVLLEGQGLSHDIKLSNKGWTFVTFDVDTGASIGESGCEDGTNDCGLDSGGGGKGGGKNK
jgi:hypothetical protein